LRRIKTGGARSCQNLLYPSQREEENAMKLWQDLFGTDYGLMSIAGIAFMIFMAVWYVRFFIRKVNEKPRKD